MCYANEVWELTLLPGMGDDEGNEFWELTLLPRMGQDKLLWVNDDVVIVDDASLKKNLNIGGLIMRSDQCYYTMGYSEQYLWMMSEVM